MRIRNSYTWILRREFVKKFITVFSFFFSRFVCWLKETYQQTATWGHRHNAFPLFVLQWCANKKEMLYTARYTGIQPERQSRAVKDWSKCLHRVLKQTPCWFFLLAWRHSCTPKNMYLFHSGRREWKKIIFSYLLPSSSSKNYRSYDIIQKIL